jgi:hypothetical protein
MKNDTEDFPNPNNIYTKEEIEGILEYRRTGKIPNIPYEELDFDNVGGILDDETKLPTDDKI